MTPEATPLYEVRNIDKFYGNVVALENVSLAIYPGEVLGLVGDNGAGKSTLVKVLSGAHQPDAGEIYLEGEQKHWKAPHDVLEAGIETLYQDSGLAPNLSVSSNVFLGRELVKKGLLGKLGFLAQKEMDTTAHADLERVGIGVASSDRAVAQLSGGQRQAVAIGRAVAWARKVIILDEPTNHLGARQANEVLDVIKAAKAKNLGVIFISHTLPHVLQVTDRIVVLRLGRIVRDAPTSEFNAETLLGTITGLITQAAMRSAWPTSCGCLQPGFATSPATSSSPRVASVTIRHSSSSTRNTPTQTPFVRTSAQTMGQHLTRHWQNSSRAMPQRSPGSPRSRRRYNQPCRATGSTPTFTIPGCVMPSSASSTSVGESFARTARPPGSTTTEFPIRVTPLRPG
jgi:simple sugar transport system ATP-binding protein